MCINFEMYRTSTTHTTQCTLPLAIVQRTYIASLNTRLYYTDRVNLCRVLSSILHVDTLKRALSLVDSSSDVMSWTHCYTCNLFVYIISYTARLAHLLTILKNRNVDSCQLTKNVLERRSWHMFWDITSLCWICCSNVDPPPNTTKLPPQFLAT